jgi:nucleoside-diphosphate-sugar epimerase
MKKNVFMTGATGVMGFETLKQLASECGNVNLTVLARPSEENRTKLSSYRDTEGIKVIWGDISDYDLLSEGVRGSDIVLHIAAVVSPEAEYNPDLTRTVNVDGTKNLIRAIQEQPESSRIALVYIGSVAETGDRLPPVHWGRVGDPMKPSIYDNYAVTKVEAERLVIESGLNRWVSLRQTGIAHLGLFDVEDGIIYHQPLENCIEWITLHDSGLLLRNLCTRELPDEFWCRIYNIGGGETCRLTGYEFFEKAHRALGIKDFRKLYECSWFAGRNFHGQWYEDSDVLNGYLDFRTQSMDDFFMQAEEEASLRMRLLKYLPKPAVKLMKMRSIARTRNGPIRWIENNQDGRISAFFGSMERWQRIPKWKDYEYKRPSDEITRLNHGYDETKLPQELELEDMMQAAAFRGGECLSGKMAKGDMKGKLEWRCAFGHEFEASPNLVLQGGHWCPFCEAPPWNYDEIAMKNPFFAQVWYPMHGTEEHNFYDENCCRDLIGTNGR